MELYGESYPRKSKGNLFRVFLKGITQNAQFLIIFKQLILKKKKKVARVFFHLLKTGECYLRVE